MDLAVFAVFLVLGGLALIALKHPRLGPWFYRSAWPGFQREPRRRRQAYVTHGALALTIPLLGSVMLLQSFRQDRLTLLSLVPLALAALAACVGIVVAIRARQP